MKCSLDDLVYPVYYSVYR